MVSTARQARTGSVTLGTVLGGIALGIAAPLAMLFARNLTDQPPYVENYWLGPVILLMHLAIGAVVFGLCLRWRGLIVPMILTMVALLALGLVLYPNTPPLGLHALPISMLFVPGNMLLIGGLAALWLGTRASKRLR